MKIQKQRVSDKVRDKNGEPIEEFLIFRRTYRRSEHSPLQGTCQNCERWIAYNKALGDWLHLSSMREQCYPVVPGSPGNACVATPYLFTISEEP